MSADSHPLGNYVIMQAATETYNVNSAYWQAFIYRYFAELPYLGFDPESHEFNMIEWTLPTSRPTILLMHPSPHVLYPLSCPPPNFRKYSVTLP